MALLRLLDVIGQHRTTQGQLGQHVTKPPVLALEILSPSSILKDRNTKFNLYQAYGVRYYLIANIEKAEIEIFELKDNRYQQLVTSQFQLTGICSVEVDVKKLFSLQ